MDLTKSIWKRTGNLPLVVIGGLGLLIATSDSITWDLESLWADADFNGLWEKLVQYINTNQTAAYTGEL